MASKAKFRVIYIHGEDYPAFAVGEMDVRSIAMEPDGGWLRVMYTKKSNLEDQLVNLAWVERMTPWC